MRHEITVLRLWDVYMDQPLHTQRKDGAEDDSAAWRQLRGKWVLTYDKVNETVRVLLCWRAHRVLGTFRTPS